MLTESIQTSEVGGGVQQSVTCENIRVSDCTNLQYFIWEEILKLVLVAACAVLKCTCRMCCNRFWI